MGCLRGGDHAAQQGRVVLTAFDEIVELAVGVTEAEPFDTFAKAHVPLPHFAVPGRAVGLTT